MKKYFKILIVCFLCISLCVCNAFATAGFADIVPPIPVDLYPGVEMNIWRSLGVSSRIDNVTALEYKLTPEFQSRYDYLMENEIAYNTRWDSGVGGFVVDPDFPKWYAGFFKDQTRDWQSDLYKPPSINIVGQIFPWDFSSTSSHVFADYSSGYVSRVYGQMYYTTHHDVTVRTAFVDLDTPMEQGDTFIIKQLPAWDTSSVGAGIVNVRVKGPNSTLGTASTESDTLVTVNSHVPNIRIEYDIYVHSAGNRDEIDFTVANGTYSINPIICDYLDTEPTTGGDQSAEFVISQDAVNFMNTVLSHESSEDEHVVIRPINPVTQVSPYIGMSLEEASAQMYDDAVSGVADNYTYTYIYNTGSVDTYEPNATDALTGAMWRTRDAVEGMENTLEDIKESLKTEDVPDDYASIIGMLGTGGTGGGGLGSHFSGIWDYVIDFVVSLADGMSLFFGSIYTIIPYSLMLPVYASAVVLIVLGVFKKFVTR